jgi:hypothetical protein
VSGSRLKGCILGLANVIQCLCCTPEARMPALFYLSPPLRHFLCIGSDSRSLLITDHFDTMTRSTNTIATWTLALIHLVCAQQQCYFGPGAENRGPTELVPCMNTGQSACCLLGDICLSGNTCWNYDTGNLYQYGCTDIHYEDASCPYKCGFNSSTKVSFPVVESQTNFPQPCHLGQPSNIASTTLK